MATKKVNYTYATGRRKESVARVRLFKGKGDSTVNGKLTEKYFPGEMNKSVYTKPFKATDSTDDYYFTAKIVSGGISSQVAALAHGLARALSKVKPKEFKTLVKKAGLLTRDAREKQRRMVGTGGKARRKKQSPKR